MEPNSWHLAKMCTWKVCSLQSTTALCSWFQQKSTSLLNICVVLLFDFLWLWFSWLGSHCAFLWSLKKPFNNCYFFTIQEHRTIWILCGFGPLVVLKKRRQEREGREGVLSEIQLNCICFFLKKSCFRLNGNSFFGSWFNLKIWNLSTYAKREYPNKKHPQNSEESSVKLMLPFCTILSLQRFQFKYTYLNQHFNMISVSIFGIVVTSPKCICQKASATILNTLYLK